MDETQSTGSARPNNRLLITLCAATLLLIAAIAWVEAAHQPRELIIPVSDMTCEGCESTLRKKLAEMPGVTEVAPSHQEKTVRVVVNGWSGPERETIEAAIRRAGYTVVETDETEL